MGFLLSIIAYILFIPTALVNFVFVIIKFSKSRGFFKVIDDYWYQSAIDIDRFGNHHFRTFWNLAFIKKNGYKFGDIEETISSALGKNQVKKSLTVFGWIIVYILWVIDYKYWFKGGHCINSIGH